MEESKFKNTLEVREYRARDLIAQKIIKLSHWNFSDNLYIH